jgi:hypothetical protein
MHGGKTNLKTTAKTRVRQLRCAIQPHDKGTNKRQLRQLKINLRQLFFKQQYFLKLEVDEIDVLAGEEPDGEEQ